MDRKKYIIEVSEDVQRIMGIGSSKDNTVFTCEIRVDALEELEKYTTEAYRNGYEDCEKRQSSGCVGCRWEHSAPNGYPCESCSNNFCNHYEAIAPTAIAPGLIDDQTRQALNNAVSVLSEAMDKIREKLEILND